MISKFVSLADKGESAFITDNIKYKEKKFSQIPTTRIMKIALKGDNIGSLKSSFNVQNFYEIVYSEISDTFVGMADNPSKPTEKLLFLQNGSDTIYKFDSINLNKEIYTNTMKIIGTDLAYLKNSHSLTVVKNLKFAEITNHRTFTISIGEGKIKDFTILNKKKVLIAYLTKKINKSEPLLYFSLYNSTGKFTAKLETQKKMITSISSSPDGNYVICVTKTLKSELSLLLLKIKGEELISMDNFYLGAFPCMSNGAVVSLDFGLDSRYLITVYPQFGKKGKKGELSILCFSIFNGQLVLIESVETEYRKYMAGCLSNGVNEVIGIANKNLCFVRYSYFDEK